MHNIDKIMTMLDSRNSKTTQERGIKLASRIKSINVFILPGNPGASINVWENCAKVLCTKKDSELIPYSTRLLEWLEDINWPGSLIILQRLKGMSASEQFVSAVNDCVFRAKSCYEHNWLDYLSELLQNEELKARVSDGTLSVLLAHYKNWGASEGSLQE